MVCPRFLTPKPTADFSVAMGRLGAGSDSVASCNEYDSPMIFAGGCKSSCPWYLRLECNAATWGIPAIRRAEASIHILGTDEYWGRRSTSAPCKVRTMYRHWPVSVIFSFGFTGSSKAEDGDATTREACGSTQNRPDTSRVLSGPSWSRPMSIEPENHIICGGRAPADHCQNPSAGLVFGGRLYDSAKCFAHASK